MSVSLLLRLLRVVPVGLALLFIIHSSDCCAQDRLKKDNCLARIAAIPIRNDFAIVTAKIRLGVDTANAYKQLDSLLTRPYGDMFWMYGCAGLYYATSDVLRPSYKQRIRKCWKLFTPYRGDTENHFLMYYGSLLLMSQAWPNLADSEWFMGKSSKEVYDESEEYLDHWINETVRYGQEEWSSPRYGYYYITPLILLAGYTKDARMKHRIEMMLEYELADYASDYLSGSYCGAHSRVSDDCVIDPRKAEINSYGEYFFEDSVSHLLPDVAFAAMTNFQCPEIIRHIAKDRSEPYEQFSLKRGRAMFRNMDKWSDADSSHDSGGHAPVYKYEYMTKDYCLGSMQGGIVQPIQQQSWSLVFNSDKPHNIITGLNPYVSNEELAMFFPEYPSFMLERIGSTKASYTNENKWEGGSPYEHIYQDKNVLVGWYDLPDTEKYCHVDIYIPLLATPLIDNTPRIEKKDKSVDSAWIPTQDGLGGWEAYQFDSTLVAIWTYSKCKQTREPNGIRLREYDSLADQQAVPLYLVYCRSIREITPNLFVKLLSNTSIRWKDDMVYSYSDIDSMHIAIEEETRSEKPWLFRSPYLESKKGSGVLTMRYKGEARVLDFRE